MFVFFVDFFYAMKDVSAYLIATGIRRNRRHISFSSLENLFFPRGGAHNLVDVKNQRVSSYDYFEGKFL